MLLLARSPADGRGSTRPCSSRRGSTAPSGASRSSSPPAFSKFVVRPAARPERRRRPRLEPWPKRCYRSRPDGAERPGPENQGHGSACTGRPRLWPAPRAGRRRGTPAAPRRGPGGRSRSGGHRSLRPEPRPRPPEELLHRLILHQHVALERVIPFSSASTTRASRRIRPRPFPCQPSTTVKAASAAAVGQPDVAGHPHALVGAVFPPGQRDPGEVVDVVHRRQVVEHRLGQGLDRGEEPPVARLRGKPLEALDQQGAVSGAGRPDEDGAAVAERHLRGTGGDVDRGHQRTS